MKNRSFTIAFLFLSMVMTGCATLNSVSLSQIPAERSNYIQASAGKLIFLAFNFNNDYVDAVERKLRSQCEGGQVKGILTKDETYLYFLFHFKKITASGYCIK